MSRWIEMGAKARTDIIVQEAKKVDHAAWMALIEADEAAAALLKRPILKELALERAARDREAHVRSLYLTTWFGKGR